MPWLVHRLSPHARDLDRRRLLLAWRGILAVPDCRFVEDHVILASLLVPPPTGLGMFQRLVGPPSIYGRSQWPDEF